MNIWNYLLIHAGIQGLVIGLILLFKRGKSKQAQIYLSALILISTGIIFNYLFENLGAYREYPHLIWLISPFWFLMGPTSFLFVKTLVKEGNSSRWIDLIHLIPFLIAIYYISPFYALPAELKLEYFLSFYSQEVYSLDLFAVLYLLQGAAYFLYSIVLLHRKRKELKASGVQETSNLVFISSFLIVLLGFYLISLVFIFLLPAHMDSLAPFYGSIIFVLSLCLHLTAWQMIRSRDFPISLRLWNSNGGNFKSVEEVKVLAARIKDYLNQNKPYLESDFRMSNLESGLGSPAYSLSHAINKELNTNFKDLVNQKRVEEAQKRLQDPEFKLLTYEAIAMDCGFNSATTFYRAFKKHTGKTPKQFQEA